MRSGSIVASRLRFPVFPVAKQAALQVHLYPNPTYLNKPNKSRFKTISDHITALRSGKLVILIALGVP